MSRKESRREWLNTALAGSAVAALGATASCTRQPVQQITDVDVSKWPQPLLFVFCHGLMAFEFDSIFSPGLTIYIPEVPPDPATKDPGHVYKAGKRRPDNHDLMKGATYTLEGPSDTDGIPADALNSSNVKLPESGRCNAQLIDTNLYTTIEMPMPQYYFGCRLARDPHGVFDTSAGGSVLNCGLYQLQQFASVHLFIYTSPPRTMLTSATAPTVYDSQLDGYTLHIHAENLTVFDSLGAHLHHLNEMCNVMLQFRKPAEVLHVGEGPPTGIDRRDLLSLSEPDTSRGGNPTNCMGYFLMP